MLKVLVVTPYSPDEIHGHAADDMGANFYAALAQLCDLHVYAPGGSVVPPTAPKAPTRVGTQGGAYTLHRGTPVRPGGGRHLGVYPAAARKDWGRANTAEAGVLAQVIAPDYVHVEYLQPLEGGLRLPDSSPWTTTMHDVTSVVTLQRARRAPAWEKPYRLLEYLRVRRLERRAMSAARIVFTLSDRDSAWVRNRVDHAVTLRPGAVGGGPLWAPPGGTTPVFVFAGAMWREANAAVAHLIVTEVMPIVWRTLPTAQIRIVGVRPPRKILDLATSRVVVVGEVDSLEREYLRAHAVLSPTLVDAGVLLKAQRALACGAPLVLNASAAAPLDLLDSVHALVRETPAELAGALIEMWTSPSRAQEIGGRGREVHARRPDWDETARAFIQALETCR